MSYLKPQDCRSAARRLFVKRGGTNVMVEHIGDVPFIFRNLYQRVADKGVFKSLKNRHIKLFRQAYDITQIVTGVMLSPMQTSRCEALDNKTNALKLSISLKYKTYIRRSTTLQSQKVS